MDLASQLDRLPFTGWRAWVYGLIPLGSLVALRAILEPLLQDESPYMLFVLAVMAGAAVGGRRVAIVATAVGAVVGVLFISASRAHSVLTEARSAQLLLFVAVSLSGTFLARQVQESHRRAQAVAAEQRRLADELASANRIKDDFLATLSHELRTPLNSVLGWSELLLKGRLPPRDAEKAVDAIHRNAKIQSRLIGDLLDLSRIAAGKLELASQALDLSEPIAAAVQTVRPAAKAKDIALRISTRPCGAVWGDAERIQQVVWNLLANAVKFTPRGGRVTVSTEQRDHTAIVRVEDSGPGVRPEMLDRIFDRFTQDDSSSTRQAGGLGLGLSIVRQLVEMHGGHVTAANAPGAGAVFEVALPVIVGAADAVAEPGDDDVERPPRRALDGISVLVVDDEPDARELMRAVLERAGATVRTASSVADALASVRSNVPDAIVTDVAMPSRDGYDLLRAIRAAADPSWRRIPAAAVSAYAGEHERERALAAGFSLHLAKPVSAGALAGAVQKLAAERRGDP